MRIEDAKKRKASYGAPRLVLRKCFICLEMQLSPDKEPPFRCHACYARVMMNEADGEL
jgi:hypothetical protein